MLHNNKHKMYSEEVREGKHLHEGAAPLNSEETDKVTDAEPSTIEKMKQQDEVRAQKLLAAALHRQLRITGN